MTLTLDVKHRLGAFALDAQFTAGKGVTALFGRSGSGKTSLVRIIAGLMRPDHGTLALDDITLADSKRHLFTPCHKRRFGYVFQEARLFPHLTVRQNLVYGRWFAGKVQTGGDGNKIIEMLGIEHLLKRYPEKLSGGEKQRVAIGRALLSSPRLLLMDEPLAALDEARKAEIIPYLERLRDETGVPIIYVSHSISEVSRLADQIVVMNGGKVDAAGSAAEILTHPAFGEQLERRDIGSILSGNVEAFDTVHGLATVRVGRLALQIPATAAQVGQKVRIHIPAREVLLATVRPEGLSALNILAGQIADIGPFRDGLAMVAVNCDGTVVTSRITSLSVERLGLTKGQTIFAIVKSAALDPY